MRAQFSMAVALGVLLGCAPEPPPPAAAGGYIDFHDGVALETLSVGISDTPVAVETLTQEEQDALVRIREQPERFLAQRPPTVVLNEAEAVFFAAGAFFELAEYYHAAVERGVTDLRPRLAWALERSGLRARAMQESAQAIDEAPNNAEAWFVRGFVLGQADEATRELLNEIRDCYAKSVELDPNFVGPNGVTADAIRAQLQGIDRAIAGAP